MSIFSKLINNSFPAPVLDIDTSDINVSDANNYIFDFSQIVADDTFEITEQSVNSISIHVLSKDFNGFTLPLTPLYSKLTDNVSFSYSAISNYPKSPYYANGYIEDSEGTRIQIFGGTASVVVPAGKSGYKWLLEPPTGHEAWDPTGSYSKLVQFSICGEYNKINLPNSYASINLPDARTKSDAGFSVICVFKDINPSDVSTLAIFPGPDVPKVVNVSDYSTEIRVPIEGVSSMLSFGTYSSVPNSGVLIYNSKEWSTIFSSGTLSKGSSESDSTLVSFNPVYDLNCVSRFILWNRDLSLDYLIDYYNKNVLPNAVCYFDVSKDYHGTHGVDSYGFGTWQLCDHSGNGLHAELKNYNRLSDVTRATNSFSFMTGRCEGEILSEGIYHITKFTPQGNGGENMTLLRLPASSFKGLGTKISIYISTPAGKTFSSGSRLVCYEGGTLDDNYDFRYPLSSGMNVIDLTDVHSLTEGNVVYLRVPDSFCDKDAEGNLIDTDTDFYIVCFPVVNLSTHVGWAWYDPNVGDLISWRNSGNIPGTLINKNKADITLCENGWDFKKVIDPIFQDDKIVVYPPFRTNFRGENLDKAGADVRSYNSTQDTLVNSTVFSKDENTGLIPVDYPGYVLFKKEGYDGYYLALYLNTKTVFEQVPNFYDFFQFKGISGAPYFNIVNKDSSYNMDIWNTVIMEFEPANSIDNTVEYYCEGTLGNIDINESREGSELAYYYDVPEGFICYINGEENTTQTAVSLRGKKTIVAIVGDNGTARGSKYIGCVGTGSANDGSNGSSTFKFYKFAAFKEKLTKEQINLAIDRYFN